MATKNALEQAKEKIQEIRDKKAADLAVISRKQEEAYKEAKEADKAIHDAAARMDITAFQKGRQDKSKAETSIEMYSARYEQLRTQEYISEADSDCIIDGLLDHEAQLADNFRADIAVLLKQLDEMLTGYREAIEDTETTIKTWTSEIHANHRTFGITMRVDPATGRYTDRMETAVPVHPLPFKGCEEAERLERYLGIELANQQGQ